MAAATDPFSCTRGERRLELVWGKCVIACKTMTRLDVPWQVTKAPVRRRHPIIRFGSIPCLPRSAIITPVTFRAAPERVPLCNQLLIKKTFCADRVVRRHEHG